MSASVGEVTMRDTEGSRALVSTAAVSRSSLDEEAYYRRICELNLAHYSAEVSYYSTAAPRPVETVLLQQIRATSTILDVGCGAGRFSVAATRLGHRVVGIDLVSQALNAAAQRLASSGTAARFVVGDMTGIPFVTCSFDYVFCPRFSINGIATAERRRRAIVEMLRVVRSDGTVFVETFNRWYLGKGPLGLLKHYVTNAYRRVGISMAGAMRRPYNGLLPGDVVYVATKVRDAPVGFAHIPSLRQLRRLIPNGTHLSVCSAEELINRPRQDRLRWFRYSLWLAMKPEREGQS